MKLTIRLFEVVFTISQERKVIALDPSTECLRFLDFIFGERRGIFIQFTYDIEHLLAYGLPIRARPIHILEYKSNFGRQLLQYRRLGLFVYLKVHKGLCCSILAFGRW